MEIILVRHGETETNKSNPERRLTAKGVKQIFLCAKKLRKLVSKKAIIISTPTIRTLESASILSSALNIPISHHFLKLELGDINRFKKEFKLKNDKEIFAEFLTLSKENQIPNYLNNPQKLIETLLESIEKHKRYETTIIVGHAGSLDVLIKFQKLFQKANPKLPLKYGQFVLFRKKLSCQNEGEMLFLGQYEEHLCSKTYCKKNTLASLQLLSEIKSCPPEQQLAKLLQRPKKP